MPSQPHDPNVEPIDGCASGLSAADPLERRLLADGARWRGHTAPHVEPFARRVNAALRESASLRLADRPIEERRMSQRIITPPPLTTIRQQPRRRTGRWGTLVAVAAAIGIVAMLTWIFQTIPHARVANKTGTPTPNPAAHVTHSRGHWADVVQYTLSSNGSVYVAPSDLRVAYRAVRSPSDPTVYALARTTDGGATWTPFTLPNDYGGWFGSLDISPLDPQTIFVTLYADQTNSHCPAYTLPPGADVGPAPLWAASARGLNTRIGPLFRPNGGGYACYFQYVSHDGGADWAHPQFPWKAQHLAESGLSSAVQTQGATLFTAAAGDLDGPAYLGARIASSADGGSTWDVADADIYVTGQIVSAYAVLPGTTTLYALSVPQQTESGQVSSAEAWRSDDAGAHWTRVGTSPLAAVRLAATTRTPGGPTLYEVRTDVAPDGKQPVYFSQDGGKTWSPVSTAGWQKSQADNPWSVNTLADGSLVLEFTDVQSGPFPEVPVGNTNVATLGWRPGDAGWFQATPRSGSGTVVKSWVTAPADSPQTLWILVADQNGTTYTVRKCVLE